MSAPASVDRSSLLEESKSRSKWGLVLVLASLVIGGGVLAGATVWHLSHGQPLPVNARDRSVLVTAANLADFVPNMIVRNDLERLHKSKLTDQTIRLTYDYEHKHNGQPIELHCWVHLAPDHSIAKDIYVEQNAVLQQSSRWQSAGTLKFTEVTCPDAGQDYACQSGVCMLVSDGGSNVGFLYVGRHGTRVIALYARGVDVKGKGILPSLVCPAVQQLPVYNPITPKDL